MADVLIVGAGLAGTSLAWHLASERSVHLVEQGDQMGSEASAQNAGMQRRLAHDLVERQLAVRAGAWLQQPPIGFEDVRREVGGLILLESDATRLDDAASDLSQRGIEIDDLTGRLELPLLAGAPYARAWWVPSEGLLDAHLLVNQFWKGAVSQGASRSLGETVRALEVSDGRVTGVRTDRGTIRAETVVLATGAWSGALARQHGLDRPLYPMARHLLQTTSDPRATSDHPWVWVDDAGVYLRPEGGAWLCSPCDETLQEPRGTGSAGPIDPEMRALAEAKLEVHLPAASGLGFRGGWTGLRTFTPDRRPLLGPDPDLPGLFWATALGGFGVTCSVAFGEAAAAMLTDRPVPWLDTTALAPGRAFPEPLVPAVIDLHRYIS